MRLHIIVQNEDTGCEHGRPFLTNLRTQNILQKLSVVCRCYSGPRRHSVYCYHSILVISRNHHELNFRVLATTFFRVRRSCMLPLKGQISVVVQTLVSIFHLWQQFCSKTAHLLPRSAATVLPRPACKLLSVLRSADAKPTLQQLLSSAVFES